MTNAKMSADSRIATESRFQRVLPDCRIVSWDGNDIARWLDDAPEIRRSYPQLMGVEDFREIVHERPETSVRSRVFLRRATELAPVFVATNTYMEALERLRLHGFVVLAGPPEAGKTAIALLIALARANAGWECFECRTPNEILSVYRDGIQQVFVVDDAFGSTEYRPDLAGQWSDGIDTVLRIADDEHWIIWTSRAAILHAAIARMRLQGIAETFPDPAKVIVGATTSRDELQAILMAHAAASRLSIAQKEFVNENAERIAGEPHLTPERIRRVIAQLPELMTSDDVLPAILSSIRDPTPAMRQSFALLPFASKLFLFALLQAADHATPENVTREFDRLCQPDVTASANDIGETLCEHFVERHFGQWRWVHPSWRDVTVELLMGDTQLRARVLRRCGIAGLRLAISTEGGPRGDRTYPLLMTDEDRDILADRITALISNERFGHVSDVLSALSAAIEGQPPRHVRLKRDRLLNVARAALAATAARLSSEIRNDAWSIPSVVERFIALRTVLGASTRLPMERTWFSWWNLFIENRLQVYEALRERHEAFDLEQRTLREQIEERRAALANDPRPEVIHLCEQLGKAIELFERRRRPHIDDFGAQHFLDGTIRFAATAKAAGEEGFLVQVGYPGKYLEHLRHLLLDAAANYHGLFGRADSDIISFTAGDLLRTSSALAEALPELAPDVRAVERSIG